MESERALILCLVLGVGSGVAGDGDGADATFHDPGDDSCVDGWMFIETNHVIGGESQPDVNDLEACKDLCEKTDGCLGIDWNVDNHPFVSSRCWLHTTPYPMPEDLKENRVVHHHNRCAGQAITALSPPPAGTVRCDYSDRVKSVMFPTRMPIFGQQYESIWVSYNGVLSGEEYEMAYCYTNAREWVIGALGFDYHYSWGSIN